MIIYCVPFESLEKYTKKVDEYGYRGFYWEEEDKFVVEVPVVSNQGYSMGICFHTEISKSVIRDLIAQKLPDAPTTEIAVKMFEQTYLTVYRKILGKYKETLNIDYLAPDSNSLMQNPIAHGGYA